MGYEQDRKMNETTRNKKRLEETSADQSWANGVIRHWINESSMSKTTTLK
jgi:hypothetical protein